MKKVVKNLWNFGTCCVYVLNLAEVMDPKLWLYRIDIPFPVKDSQVWVAELCFSMAIVKEVAIGATLRVGPTPSPNLYPVHSCHFFDLF